MINHIPNQDTDNSDEEDTELIYIDYRKLGRRIGRIRRSQRISQLELAELIQMSPSFISYIETGKRKLSLRTLILIANALHTTPDIILHDYISPTELTYVKELSNLLSSCTTEEKQTITNLTESIVRNMHQN